jgi:hypothetical protein
MEAITFIAFIVTFACDGSWIRLKIKFKGGFLAGGSKMGIFYTSSFRGAKRNCLAFSSHGE